MLPSGRLSFVDKIKSLQEKVNNAVDTGIKGYNDKIATINSPTVKHDVSQNTIILVVVALAVFLFIRKK